MDHYEDFLTILGAIAWGVFLLIALGPPALTPFLEPISYPIREIPAGLAVLPLFFLTASSWLGAGMFLFGRKIISAYHWRAKNLCLAGMVQALFPFLSPLIPLSYFIASRRTK